MYFCFLIVVSSRYMDSRPQRQIINTTYMESDGARRLCDLLSSYIKDLPSKIFVTESEIGRITCSDP